MTIEEVKGYSSIAGRGTASGTNTYTVTIPEVKSYSGGLHVFIKFTNANTTASTLNINSLGAVSIKKQVSLATASGDIPAGVEILLVHDGTNFQIVAGDINVSTVTQTISTSVLNFSQSII